MTVFLDFRERDRAGGSLSTPRVVSCAPTAGSLNATPLSNAALNRALQGREVAFVSHGFNVSRGEGVRALSRFEQELALPPSFAFVGVLWPGDWWIPVINYPSEANDAVTCGRALARYINQELRVDVCSFVSHSLGARLVLEAALGVDSTVRDVCLMAAAVDDDALITEPYRAVQARVERLSVLASLGDWVLRLAYPAGDFLSDLWYDSDSPFRGALGYHGPRPRAPQRTISSQIRDPQHDHGSYLPPEDARTDTPPAVMRVETYVNEVLRRVPHTWPL